MLHCVCSNCDVVQAAGTPPPADVCGCQNDRTCVVQTRRVAGVQVSGYRGRNCET